jgi:hypothetical protein
MRRYANAEAEFLALGGYAAESEAAAIASSLGLPERVLDQPLGTLSGGQRRRVELARILFSGADTLLLDEPTNHLDADSIVWLREFLRATAAGSSSSATTSSCSRPRQPGLPPRCQPLRARRLQRGLEGVPAAARDRRAPPPPRAANAEKQAARCRARPTACAPRRPRPRPRRTWPVAPNGCSTASRRAPVGQGRRLRFPDAGAVRPTR